ncbi:MAG: alpha/beta superfamily hydrolase [Gammaproteobacteria bacterium]|jgi:alpha/beta superfamily hydrolase
MLRYPALLLILLVCPAIAMGYNSSYEERIAKQLAEGKPEKEVVWLKASGREFIALYQDYKSLQPKGAVILLHAMGGHPDWPEVVSPLRNLLPELGWATLSLQMPVLSPEESIADYGKTLGDAKLRIDAAVQQLRDRRFLNIVVIGYSFGAATAVHTLSGNEIKNVNAFVGISMQAQQFLNPKLKLLRELETVSIPMLDIYGSRDTLEVRREVHDRRLAARKNGNSAYQQMVIEGADHYFTGLIEVLVKRINGWLAKSLGEIRAMEEDETGDATSPKQGAKTGE